MAEWIQRHMQNLTIDNDPPPFVHLQIEARIPVDYVVVTLFHNTAMVFWARVDKTPDQAFYIQQFL
ncbi:MAG: hypothetical protein KDK60_00695, partial [Chlamydiia bacterium]|nr:hypothetical protein [Chlamydiia bacterium]